MATYLTLTSRLSTSPQVTWPWILSKTPIYSPIQIQNEGEDKGSEEGEEEELEVVDQPQQPGDV